MASEGRRSLALDAIERSDMLEPSVEVGVVAHIKVMMIGAVGGLAAYGGVILLIYLFRMIGLTGS